jgi:hypothetical protein
VWNLQEALNKAAEKMAVSLYTPDLDDRFQNMARGHVINNKSCPHASNFNLFEPPRGSVCTWSVLMTLVTGSRDPRWTEGTFDQFNFPCHSVDMNSSMNMIIAFSEITQVSILKLVFNC